MGRKPKRKPKTQAEFASREEYEHRLCYAYVECGSYGAVAKQFGTHAQTVKRAWEKLTPEQQQSIRDANATTKEKINRKMRQSIFKQGLADVTKELTEDDMVEALNRSTIKAEALVSEEFVTNVMQSRKMLGEELVRRCGDSLKLSLMSHKDFAMLLRLVTSISEVPEDKDKPGAEQGSTLQKLRMDIANEIYKQQIN